MKLFLNKMKSANGPDQQFLAAKRFMKTMQWSIILCFIPFMVIDDLIRLEEIGAIILAICFVVLLSCILLWFMPNLFIDKDFYNDVMKLEEYV